MAGGLADRVLSWIDANLATLGHGFMREWSKVERSYRRPLSRMAFRLKFAFYPLLAHRRDRLAGLGLEPRPLAQLGRKRDLRSRGAVAPVRAEAVRPRGRGRDRRVLDRVLPRPRRRRLAVEPATARGPARPARSRRRARGRLRRAVRRSVAGRPARRPDPGGHGQGRRRPLRLRLHAAASGLRRQARRCAPRRPRRRFRS